MSVEASGPADGDLLPGPSSAQDVIVSGFGGGTYSFTCHGHFEYDDPDSESVRDEPGDEIGFAARFQLDAPPVQLTRADAIIERRCEGDTLAFRTTASPTKYERLAVFIVERIDGSGEASDGATADEEQRAAFDQPEVIVTERVLRERQLRNALIAFNEEPDVRVAKVVAPTSQYPPFAVTEPRVIEYDDRVYRITSEEFPSGEA